MASNNQRLFRKILRIRASDSPNVRLALAEIAAGKQPSNTILVQGVLTYEQYVTRRATWDKIRQCVGLDGEFYEGAEVLLFPPDWLNESERKADQLKGKSRKALSIGIDPAEGIDNTAMAVVDDKGLIELISKQTADTSRIVGEVIAFMTRHQVPPNRVQIDRGGGGKFIADTLRSKGYPIRTVAFGESITLAPKHGTYLPKYRKENIEERYTYVNRRAQMYGELRELLDISINPDGFAIPSCYPDLRKQLAVIPLQYDPEGRLILPPKHRKPGAKETTIKTLVEIIGKSPDEADALVLAVHGLLHEDSRPRVGPVW